MDKANKKQIADVMHDIYHEVAYDIPRAGQYHWASAVDICKDWAYDRLNSKMDLSKVNLETIARKVVNEYCSNDTALSKRKEKAAEKAALKKSVAKQPKQPRIKQWDDYPPVKNKLGISSY